MAAGYGAQGTNTGAARNAGDVSGAVGEGQQASSLGTGEYIMQKLRVHENSMP
jgi:hypothetical protein